MDLVEAALAGVRSVRGKAGGGMAIFDVGFEIGGIETDGDGKLPDFEYLSTEGPTREYLQRRVTQKLFPWKDLGEHWRHDDKTFAFLQHAGGKIRVTAIDLTPPEIPRLHMRITKEVTAPWWPADRPTDLIELPDAPVPRKRVRPLTLGQSPRMADGGGVLLIYGPSARQRDVPAEICYLDERYPWVRLRQGSFNSYDKLGDVAEVKPKPLFEPPKTPSWTNSLVFAVDYFRRSALRKDACHEIEILRRADAVQTSPRVSRRRGRHRTQAHDKPQRILQAGIARKARA
jgi:hypothetical protein